LSVATVTSVRYRFFPGFPDDSLPIGYWAVSGLTLGDASGGTREVQLEFNPATAPRGAVFFSLEQVTVHDGNNAAKQGEFRTVNMDPIPGLSAVAITNRWAGDLEAGAASAMLNPATQTVLRGWWLGRQAVAAVATQFRFLTTNSDLNILTVTAQGYLWGPRSQNAPGGPSRPLQGLYPT